MFSSLFFLILTVLLINLAPDIRVFSWMENPWSAFGEGLMLYGFLLFWITIQNRVLANQYYRSHWLVVVNVEIILFLIVYLLVMGSDRIFGNWQSLSAITTLGLYFFALYVFHYTFPGNPSPTLRKKEAVRQFKLVIPFAVPFLLIVIVLDSLSWIPPAWNNTVILGTTLFAVAAMFVFLPTLLTQAWGCVPIRDVNENNRLEDLCRKAHFKHAGVLEWTVMNQSPTAAIVGVVPNFRYILFSRYLLQLLPPSAVDAILAHEIGHSKKKHLLLYPLIIIGMIIFAAFAGEAFEELFQSWRDPLLRPIALFLVYAIALGLYFRFVFGYFSRLFERQADLYGLELGLPLQDMMTALDQVGIATGNTHNHPSWHHFSLAERIAFLQKCIDNPIQVIQHHRKVTISLFVFFILLLVALLVLFS